MVNTLVAIYIVRFLKQQHKNLYEFLFICRKNRPKSIISWFLFLNIHILFGISSNVIIQNPWEIVLRYLVEVLQTKSTIILSVSPEIMRNLYFWKRALSNKVIALAHPDGYPIDIDPEKYDVITYPVFSQSTVNTICI